MTKRRRGRPNKKSRPGRPREQHEDGVGAIDTYFSSWLLHLRADLDQTLEGLAPQIGVSHSVIWRWEMGSRLPGRKDRAVLERLSRLGGIDVPALYGILLHSVVERAFVSAGVRLDPQARRDLLGIVGGLVDLARSTCAGHHPVGEGGPRD
jgi:transcriptional regulator with XRE-family HTH domain